MDHIRREDLREEMVVVPSNTYEQGWNDALRSVYRNAPSVDSWIPISERLPEVAENGLSEWVLVTTKGIDKTEVFCDRICHGEWLTPCFEGEEVLAWQPLPEPYKAEEEVSE